MAGPCPLLGDGMAGDTLLDIARFLPTAKDLLCLELTHSRFAAKRAGAAAAAVEMLCIAHGAGRLWLADLRSWKCG